MKEHIFPYESFIGGWYIPTEVCDNLLDFYEKNKEIAYQGKLGNNNLGNNNSDLTLDTEKKDCQEIRIPNNISFFPFYDYKKHLQECLENYVKKYKWANDVQYFDIHQDYNIQHYKPGQGFKIWHCERQGNESCFRHLVFMTYLNDVEDGGTEFYHQKLTSPAKKGLTVIWPTDWTHTHKGQVSKTKEKYIVTGWYSFKDE